MPLPKDALDRALDHERVLPDLGREFDALGSRYSGKVRENFTRVRDGRSERMIVVTDRVSAFDVVLGTIPFKGQVLNGMARYWFEATADIFRNHVLSFPDPQAVLAHECEPIKVEMVVRGYLTGVSSTSIWTAYERGERTFCGHGLPEGLRKHEVLPANIVTPSTKAEKGEHDRSVSKDELFAAGVIDATLFEELEARCLRLFERGQALCAERGLILVDTKYELGRRSDGEIVLIDEIHTPDSSRFWHAEGYERAMRDRQDPRSLDKEFVRRWLVSRGYRGDGPPPALDREIRREAAERYVEIFEQVTGRSFDPDLDDPAARLRRNLLGA